MILNSGGAGDDAGHHGQEGTITGKACPKGLYGIFCEVCSYIFLFSLFSFSFLGLLRLLEIFTYHICDKLSVKY